MSKFLTKRRSRRSSEDCQLSEEGGRRGKEHGSVTSLVNHEQLLPQQSSEEEPVALTISRGKEDVSTFFKDQKRKTDFVLVFEEDKKDAALCLLPKELEGTDIGVAAAAQAFKKLGKKKQRFRLWRQKFLAGLTALGLHVEEEVNSEGGKSNVHFIKLHAPWPLLCRFAEELNLRAPLQAHPNPSGNWTEWLLAKLHIPNLMAEEVPNKPLDYYTCPFKMSKLDRFLGSDDIAAFFSRAQRSRIVYEILCTTPFGREKKGEVGVNSLVDQGAFSAAFPLHDGDYRWPGDVTPHHLLNARQVLYHFWARWGKWYKYQPLDHIREYFGERIAVYFAWLGFYTGWLLPAALVGLVVFLYGLFTLDHNVSAQEVCSEKAKNVTMCPLCANCSTWDLHQICDYTRIAYLFDHPGTVFYAVFMSFWAVTFLEYWKRKNASLAHHWDCLGFQDEEERPRPEFAAKAPYLEKNPITGVREPAFPKAVRLRRIAAGSGLIMLMIMLVVIFILAVIIYRTLASIYLFSNPHTRPLAQILASSSGAMINLCAIMALGRVYEQMAERLTIWEMHRTQSEFDDNLTFKVFIFQFINFYSSIIYIAFFKGKFVGYPGHYKNIVGDIRNEDCGNGGCLIELAQQLAVIMVGKQVINNAQEIIIPRAQAWWQNMSHMGSKPGKEEKSQIEEDYRLVDNEGLFQEYLEMVLQFGFITIFVAAFPLAPLFALLNNWVEIRLDAQKFVRETRRAVAERAENIGIWFKILEMLAQLAVISNAFLIAFTSDFIQKLVYKYEYGERGVMRGYVMFTLSKSPVQNWIGKGQPECYYRGFRDDSGTFTPVHWKILALKFAFVIIFEHLVFGVCKLIDILVPDIPESLDIKVKRERYLAKEALQDAEHVLQKVLTDREDEAVSSEVEQRTGSPVLRKRASQEARESPQHRMSPLLTSTSPSTNHLSGSHNQLPSPQLYTSTNHLDPQNIQFQPNPTLNTHNQATSPQNQTTSPQNQTTSPQNQATSPQNQTASSQNQNSSLQFQNSQTQKHFSDALYPVSSNPMSALSHPLAPGRAAPRRSPSPSEAQPPPCLETTFAGVTGEVMRVPPPTRPRAAKLQRGTTIPTPPPPSRAPSISSRTPSLSSGATSVSSRTPSIPSSLPLARAPPPVPARRLPHAL